MASEVLTVGGLMERLRSVPEDTPVVLRVIDRNDRQLRTTTFIDAWGAGLAGEEFLVTGYGRKELEHQEAYAALKGSR